MSEENQSRRVFLALRHLWRRKTLVILGTLGVTVAGLGRVAVDRFNACDTSQPRTLLLRPEDVSVLTDAADLAENNMNVFNLTIEATVQYGNDSLLLGKIGDGTPLRVRVVAKAGRNLPASGTVRVGWPSSAGYVV